MAQPIISVIIPTRNRPDTLKVCLAALRYHRSPSIEFLVQDNCSGPETASVIAQAQGLDRRVRVSSAPHPVSQRQNFELGLAAAAGEYLTIIGDDDGFCLGALDWLTAQLAIHPADAVRWTLVHYVWPSLSADGEGFLRLYPTKCYGGWHMGSGQPIAAKTLIAANDGSWENILVYHGMISRRLYDRMRSRTGGTFFAYPLPDVYAHNLISLNCERVLYVDNPMSIYGTSGHSAGSSWGRVTDPASRNARAGQLWMQESLADPVAAQDFWQPNIRTLRYHDYCVLKLAEANGQLGGVVLNQETWIAAIIAEISKSPWTLRPWLSAQSRAPFDPAVFGAVRQHFSGLVAHVPPAPDGRYAPVHTDSVLRVRQAGRGWADTVEGAMLALDHALSDGQALYDAKPPAHTWRTSTMRKVHTAVNRVHTAMPVLGHNVMHKPGTPEWLKRALRRLKWPESPRSLALKARLQALRAT